MPIIHITSLSLNDIAHILSENLLSEQRKSPLSAPVVIMPNQNIRKWLDLNLARISGLSTNISYQFLDKALEEYYLVRAGFGYDRLKSPFPNQESMQKEILSYLLKNRNNKKGELVFLSNYLESLPRSFSLSSRLALLFKNYELNRSSWIEEWAKECDITIPMISKRRSAFPADSDYLRMEKKIYQDLFLNKRKINPKIQASTTNQFFLREVKKEPVVKPSRFPSIHLFCISNLADTYLGILESMSSVDNLPVYLYQFHSGNVTKLSEAGDDQGPVRWSRPQIHISARILSIPGSRTISHESQNSLTEQKNISSGLAGLRKILKGEKINPEIIPRNDHSVRFWNAPSVYREIEAVANDILYKMSIDSDLTYLDFAILVTDMQAYRPAVESVFDGGILLQIANRKDEISGNSMPVRKKLPYSLTDIKASESSLLHRGLTDFWDACSANGIRKEAVLHLLHNPLFSSKWNLDEEAILEIDKLISESGMQYEEKNNEKDPFQISNSLRRIRLSSVLDPDSSWLNHRLSSIVLDSHKAAVNLTEIWETIHSGKETVHSVLQNGNWNSRNIERIQNVVEDLFGFSGLSENELNLFQNWKEALADWEGLESEQEKYEPGQKEKIKVGLELLRFITEQAFEKIPYRKGSYLTGGVTISLLQPMRPIPFKNVYILGLGEGKFPGSPDMSQLNLRRDVQEEWDISRREVQESLLWESLHSAEASLTLSYVGKNLLEDKTFEPCSSLLELMQCFGIQNAIEIPLHSYSDRYTHSKEELNKGLVSFDFSRIWINSDRKNHPLLKQFQDPDSLENLQEETKRTSIDVRELSEFLSDPLETYLKKKLGMYSGEEEEPTEEGEVFSLEALAESIVLKKLHLQMFPDIVSDKPWSWDEKKIRAELGTVIVEEIASARFPQSIYAKVQEKKLLGYLIITSHILESWRTSLLGGTYHRYISLGDTGLHKEICKKLPGLKINLLDAKQKNIPDEIEIRGEWEHVIEKDGAYFWLFSKSLEAKPEFDWKGYKDYWKTMSRPFLSAVALGTTLNNFWIYSFRSRPSYPEGGNENTLLLHYKFTEPTEKKNPSGYLKKLILNYLREEPFFFPRKAFLKYYTREIQQGKSKKSGPDLVQKYDAVDDWKIFLHEEIESIQSDLPPIVGLYPKTGELILSSEISWAKEFYKPFLDWKEEG